MGEFNNTYFQWGTQPKYTSESSTWIIYIYIYITKTSQESVILLDYYYVFLNQDIVGEKIMLRHCHQMSYIYMSKKKEEEEEPGPSPPLQPQENYHEIILK